MTEGALALFRFLHFTAAMLLWGATVLRLGQVMAPGERRIACGLSVINLVAALGWLAAEAAVAGNGWADAANPAVLMPLLQRTWFGVVWAPHLLLALVLPLVAWRATGPAMLAIGTGLNLAAPGLIGHAVLPSGGLSILHQALSVLHLLAAGFWVGGLVLVARLLAGAPETRLLRRFSVIGHGAVATVIVTGTAKAVLIETAQGRFDPA
jgi:putative copper resistance protein D